MKLWKWQMIELVLLLLLLLSCESKPTEEQLVRECQNRNGVPNIQQRGEFKWEIASTPSPIGVATRGASKERLADIRNFIRTPVY